MTGHFQMTIFQPVSVNGQTKYMFNMGESLTICNNVTTNNKWLTNLKYLFWTLNVHHNPLASLLICCPWIPEHHGSTYKWTDLCNRVSYNPGPDHIQLLNIHKYRYTHVIVIITYNIHMWPGLQKSTIWAQKSPIFSIFAVS